MFLDEIQALRADYEQRRETSNLVPPAGRPVWDIDIRDIDGTVQYSYWYEIGSEKKEDHVNLQCIRLSDLPGTLSGDILRLKRNLPALDPKHSYEIRGDEIRVLPTSPAPPDSNDDSEDIHAELLLLPLVAVDPTKHFVKKGKYASEIRNLLACQGGSCQGIPRSPHIIRLLEKSAQDDLVFEKMNPRYILASVYPLSQYKTWILHLIDGLMCLHSLGIVHRDLRIDNLVFTPDGSTLCIIDLESRWGNRLAPEISRDATLDAGWTEKSDIYDIGHVIKGMIFGNTPVTNVVEWAVPAPLDAVVEACTRALPEQRPTLRELYHMVSALTG